MPSRGRSHFRGCPEIHESAAATAGPQATRRPWHLPAQRTAIEPTLHVAPEPAIDARMAGNR